MALSVIHQTFHCLLFYCKVVMWNIRFLTSLPIFVRPLYNHNRCIYLKNYFISEQKSLCEDHIKSNQCTDRNKCEENIRTGSNNNIRRIPRYAILVNDFISKRMYCTYRLTRKSVYSKISVHIGLVGPNIRDLHSK